MRNTLLIIGVVCMLAFHSCNTCSRRQTVDVTVNLADLVRDSAYFDMARRVLYSLPTPVEMSILIKNLGIPWNSELLNDPEKASEYLTSNKMALNLGAYLTNLTYSGLFDQSQMALRYKLAIGQLIEGLGLQSAINFSTLQELEQNINDKDRVLRIISDTYYSCAALLNESERYALTLRILAGGWVESMYIATNMLNYHLISNESQIQQLIIDQILTFDLLWQAMTDLQDVPGVDDLFGDLLELAQLFDTIGIFHTENIVTVLADSDISEISSESITTVTPEEFENIKLRILILRENFTNT